MHKADNQSDVTHDGDGYRPDGLVDPICNVLVGQMTWLIDNIQNRVLKTNFDFFKMNMAS